MAGYHHRLGMSNNAVSAYRRNLKSISAAPRQHYEAPLAYLH